MNEIEVVAKVTPAEISCNFEEIKAGVSAMMSAYEGLEITEETESERRADLATLRKIRTAIDDKRKDVKRLSEKPYKDFESKVKEVLAVIDEPIDSINQDLKELDKKRVEAKQKHLRELYDQHIGEYAEYLPFEAVKRPQWDNKTYKDNEILFDISESRVKIENDLTAIKALSSEIEPELLKLYKGSRDLTAVLRRNTDYENAKRIAEERARADAERKAAAEQAAKAEAEKKAAEAEQPTPAKQMPEPVATVAPMEPPTPPVNTRAASTVHFIVAESDAAKVRDYLTFSGIHYEEG